MIDNMTIGEAKKLASMFAGLNSAGVHIGDVVYVNPTNSMEVKLDNALRLWKWEGGGLSLSAVAKDGIKGGRLNATGEVYLTNAIEYIPTTPEAEATYIKFIE